MAAKKKQEDKEIKSRKPGSETKKKVAAAAPQQSEDRYRTLVEKAFEGIIVIRDGEIVFANPRAYAIIGYPRDQVAPRAFMDFIHPDDAEILTGNYLRRLKGEQFEETYTIRLVDQKGDIKWAQISTSLINWEGKPATLTFLTDIHKLGGQACDAYFPHRHNRA
ncbi:MAG: PAS domain S-box protein [Chloroflexi bacterium]|nr:PAS domain S-box protein [Chloroflexota bacterium]